MTDELKKGRRRIHRNVYEIERRGIKERNYMNWRESLSLPYGGTELWYSCLDSLKDNYPVIKEKILKDERQICRPSSPSLILYHLYDTEITYELAQVIVDSLIRSRTYIQKLAIIGLSKEGKHNIKKYLQKSKLQLNITVKYFDDFEKAKEWLVRS